MAPSDRDDLRCFVLDPQLAEDTWFDALDVRPGDKEVVHHALVFLDPNAASRAKGGAAGSYPCFGGPGVGGATLVSAWAPGVPATRFPADVGVRVPKGALLVMQVHYHPTSTTRTDATTFLLRRRPTKPTWAARVTLLGNFASAPQLLAGPGDPSSTPTFLIPAGAKGHTESMEVTMPAAVPEVRLLTVGTHMHWLGTNMTIAIDRSEARGVQPATECLVATPHYDFNWQRGYTYRQPLDALPTLKAGDKLRMRCTYDNSLGNANLARALADQRLASPIDVRLGEATLDEMCLGAFTLLTPAL